jgi:imidazolonepropionase-like amidohydrolase
MTDMLVITGGTLIDGTGAPARPNDGVVLSGDQIVGLGEQAVLDAGREGEAERIDATGKTVMPGLIDAHTHLSFGEPTGNDELFFHRTQGYSSMLTAYNARKVLRAGVTSALDADCLWNIAVELRDAIESNIVEGPRMKAGGQALMTMLGGTAGRLVNDTGRTGYAMVVENRDVMVNEIRRQIKYGVDWIKVMVTGLIPSMKGPEVKVWTFDELKTVCDTAHELNTRVVAHCRNAASTTDAARAGVDLIYHASYLDDESLEAILENGTALCPTFTLLGNLADYGEKVGSAPELLDTFRAEIELTATMLAKAHAAGVPMLTGSETGFAVTPVGEWHARELEMFVQYLGMSPLEAITCGTRNGAFAVRMEGEVGTLETGMKADVLVANGDPLADITVLQRKDAFAEVISRGRRVDLVTPIPERRMSSGEQVQFLASCPLTRSLALTEAQLQQLSRV